MATATSLTWPMVGRGEHLERAVTALADPEVRVVHLVGEAGTGKSRLAQECLASAELDGYPVAHLRVTAGSAAVPLSALAPLLPATAALPAPREAVDAIVTHVRDLGDGSRVVVHVDDVDALDAVSADVLARLWGDGLVVVVATQRSGTTTPPVLLAEQRRGGVLRLTFDNLTRRSVTTLLHQVLRGPVSGEVQHRLWTMSDGNPLYLRELVTSATLDGRIVRSDGVWVLDGPLTVGGGLAELVAERVGHLEGPARDLVDLLALCAPLGVDELLTHVQDEVLEQLEASGVVVVTARGRRQEVLLAHPLHVQVLRDRMPRLRSRRLLLDQVTRTEAHGRQRRDDALRVAAWCLDATGTADAELLVAGAELARTSHDYTQVERLTRAALLLHPDPAAATLLGEALYEQGRFDEAHVVLREAHTTLPAPGTGADGILVRLTLVHAIVLFFGLGRADEALAALESTTAALREAGATGTPSARNDHAQDDGPAALASLRALLLTQSGRSQQALAALPADPPHDPALAAIHARANAWALLRTGDARGAADLALTAWNAASDGSPGLLHPAGHLMVAALALLELGEPQEARVLAARGRDHATGQGVPYQAAWLAWAVATVDLVTGYAEDARIAFRELAATAARDQFVVVERLALLGLTECAALLGEAPAARSWYERAQEIPASPAAFDPASTMARAWLAAVEGDDRSAASALLEHGTELAERGEWRDAAALLDEAVLFGSASGARALLEMGERVQTPVGRARILRAAALLSGSPADLMAAAESFAACDFVHSAATMAVRAARGLRAAGDARAGAAAETRARAWAARSASLVVPGLGSTAETALLTPRESEIAGLVARGRTSREVATDLMLSVRTVDNHLANVYSKLGIGGRAELATALGLVPELAGTGEDA